MPYKDAVKEHWCCHNMKIQQQTSWQEPSGQLQCTGETNLRSNTTIVASVPQLRECSKLGGR